jgi:hypothetical protein
MKKIPATVLFMLMINMLHAQGMKDILNRAKSDVQNRVTQKADQKITQTVDNSIDKGIYKIFGKNAGSIFTANSPGAAPQPKPKAKKEVSSNGKTNENGEIIIATNIKCAAGKKAIEQTVMDTPGVSAALLDANSGLLYLTLSGTLSSYDDIITLIRKNGYTADGKKSIAGTNLCK